MHTHRPSLSSPPLRKFAYVASSRIPKKGLLESEIGSSTEAKAILLDSDFESEEDYAVPRSNIRLTIPQQRQYQSYRLLSNPGRSFVVGFRMHRALLGSCGFCYMNEAKAQLSLHPPCLPHIGILSLTLPAVICSKPSFFILLIWSVRCFALVV